MYYIYVIYADIYVMLTEIVLCGEMSDFGWHILCNELKKKSGICPHIFSILLKHMLSKNETTSSICICWGGN